MDTADVDANTHNFSFFMYGSDENRCMIRTDTADTSINIFYFSD
jgi:hypothetical protein